VKLTVISDIHANLEAFYEALLFIHREGTDEIYILGDIVGYGANPDECTSLTDYLVGGRDNPGFEIKVETDFLELKECNVRVLAGNHDCAVVNRLPLNYFNVEARKALLWTRKRLSEKNSCRTAPDLRRTESAYRCILCRR
jgi:predicted phosphodiesterase